MSAAAAVIAVTALLSSPAGAEAAAGPAPVRSLPGTLGAGTVVVPSRDAAHVRAAGAALLGRARPDLRVDPAAPASGAYTGVCTELPVVRTGGESPARGEFRVLLHDLPGGSVEVGIWRLSVPADP